MRFLFWPVLFLVLIWGICKFLIVRRTPSESHQKMIDLYSRMGGWPLDFISMILRRKKVFFAHHLIEGDQFKFNGDKMSMKSLRENGYIFSKDAFSNEEIKELINFSSDLMGTPRAMDGDINNYQECKFDNSRMVATRFDFDSNELIKSPIIQNFISSPRLISFLQEYLGGVPILTNLNMWWSVPIKGEPDYEAAQEWHFDMDRPKWLKCFIYLTDVSEENGPHQFISGSHLSKGIPLSLRKLGYVRLDNNLVRSVFPPELFISFFGNAGTMIIEDTKGLHRGKAPTIGSRLILAIEFSTTLFGASYKTISIPEIQTPQFKRMIDMNPKIYQMLEKRLD